MNQSGYDIPLTAHARPRDPMAYRVARSAVRQALVVSSAAVCMAASAAYLVPLAVVGTYAKLSRRPSKARSRRGVARI
ncbi:MAG: hypothetical protein JWR07_1207 [Nevskia sp.]|nr:hypothetical protein [Nevskia sp.]